MLEKISEGRMDKDIVTLHRFKPDDKDERYVFTVDGPRASGMGSVGAGVKFVHIRTDRFGVTVEDEAEIDDMFAVPRMQVWADAHCMGSKYPQGHENIMLNGAVYEYGISWEKSPAGDFWVNTGQSLGRVGAKMTPVGSDRIRRILQVARDLYMKVPDIENVVTRRAIKGEMQRIVKEMQAGYTRIDLLGQKLSTLDENGERA